jgi:hypothetical protein
MGQDMSWGQLYHVKYDINVLYKAVVGPTHFLRQTEEFLENFLASLAWKHQWRNYFPCPLATLGGETENIGSFMDKL